jgi:ketosteroid isomerase-like protein
VSIGYAEAGELLEAFARAVQSFDGDLVVALFTEDGEYREDPFSQPLVGHNALRAHWLAAAATQRDVAITIEQHLVSGDAVVAVWHRSRVLEIDGSRRRASGVLLLDTRGGKIVRLRQWWHEREASPPRGQPS